MNFLKVIVMIVKIYMISWLLKFVYLVTSTSMICKTFPFSGACFLRTDQMDGETDWKLRLTVAPCQRLPCDAVSQL